MRKAILALIPLLLFVATVSFAQTDEKQYYERRAKKYTNRKYTGIVLGSVGLVALGTGIGLMASAEWTHNTNSFGGSSINTKDPSGIAGFLMVVAGIPLTTLGIIFTTIGTRKSKYYRRKATEITTELGYSPINNSVTFRCRF